MGTFVGPAIVDYPLPINDSVKTIFQLPISDCYPVLITD
jgi:hypothetical protein